MDWILFESTGNDRISLENVSFYNSNNFVGLVHIQAAQCMTKLQLSQSLSLTCLPRTRPSTTFTGFLFTFFVVLALSTTPSLQRPRPLRETAGKQIFDIFIFTINCLFRFIRKTLGHEEEERTKTLENIHKTKNGSDGDVTLLPSQRFFSQLERKEVEGLIQKYQIDLEMWGYSPQKYLEFAKN